VNEPLGDDLKRRLLDFLDRDENERALQAGRRHVRDAVVYLVASSMVAAVFISLTPTAMHLIAPHAKVSSTLSFTIVGTCLAVATTLVFALEYFRDLIQSWLELICGPVLAACLVAGAAVGAANDPIAPFACMIFVTLALSCYGIVVHERNAAAVKPSPLTVFRNAWTSDRSVKNLAKAALASNNWFVEHFPRIYGGLFALAVVVYGTVFVVSKPSVDASAFLWWLVFSLAIPTFVAVLIVIDPERRRQQPTE
jgi:hypothetical protein